MMASIRSSRFYPTRRQFSLGLSAAAAAAACTFPALPAMSGGTDPSVMTWAGWDVPDMYPSYKSKYGTLPNFSFMNATEDALTKLRAGAQLDVCVANDADTKRWFNAGVISPIDEARLTNWPSAFESVRKLDTMYVNGVLYFVPAIIFSISILYRSDLVQRVESWADLWDDKYTGRVAMLDNAIDCVMPAAIGLGFDPFNLTDDQLSKVADVLRKQKQVAKFYWSNPTDLEQAMASGEVVIAYGWGESFPRMIDQGVPIGYARPKEGMIMGLTGGLISRNRAADDQRIYDFLDSWISPEAGKFIFEKFGMASVNQKSIAAADPKRLKQIGMESFEDDFKKAIILKDMRPDLRQKINLTFEQVKAGL